MNSPTIDIGQQVDLNQKRHFLEDPKDPQTRLITNIIIYGSQYYPWTKAFVTNAIKKIADEHVDKVYEAFQWLFNCIQRQVVYGPSSSHLPPSEIPNKITKDISLTFYNNRDQELLKQSIQAWQQLQLSELIPQGRISELLWYNCSKLLSMKSVQQNTFGFKQYRQEVQIDGQSWLQSTPFTSLIVLLENLLQVLVGSANISASFGRKFRLLWARLAQLHNKHLKNPVKKLCEIVLCNYKEAIASSINNISFEDYIQLLLEYAYSLLYYYKYTQCEKLMRHCSVLLKMKIQFTGKLGRRTKYQVFDTPLLVMDLVQHKEEEKKEEKIHDQEEEEEQEHKIQLIDAKELVARERGTEKVQNANINPSAFDEESILLQVPKFVEEEDKQQPKSLKELNEHHLLVALGILYFEWRSTPHDEMLMQNVTAGIQALLKYKDIKTSFSYTFALLLLRSLNEFPRIKNTERALDQLEKLKMSFNHTENKDTSNLFATPYETQLGFILILAEKYMELGLSISAVDLFEQAGLYQECIDGLIAKSYKQKALQLTNKLLSQKGKNPRLLCMLGDIEKENAEKHYQEAWQLSKQTSARAMRSLGWLFFNKKDYLQAAECFSKATKASYYHPSTWFTLGCSYMRLNQFDKALKAFSECISIDETQGQAWGNMASCYMFNKKLKQAYSTLIQAVKYSQSNWKLWANLLSVSLTLKQFYRYFQSIEKVVKLGHQEILTYEMFAKLVQIMKYQDETAERKRIAFNYKNRIDRLFAFLQQAIGQNELIWAGKTLYQIQLLEYYDILNVHYHNLHLQNKVDVNDLVPGYQTLNSTDAQTQIKIATTKAHIVQCKQCELNMTMKIGWDQNKLQCQRVKKTLQEYVEIYKQYSSKTDKEDFKLFVSGVSQKISNCLQEPYSVIIDWL